MNAKLLVVSTSTGMAVRFAGCLSGFMIDEVLCTIYNISEL